MLHEFTLQSARLKQLRENALNQKPAVCIDFCFSCVFLFLSEHQRRKTSGKNIYQSCLERSRSMDDQTQRLLYLLLFR